MRCADPQREPCRSPAVKGRKRCRMHGGAAGSGARAGNTNALKGSVAKTDGGLQRGWGW